MLYQLLTGEKPFEGGLTAIMHKVLHTEPPPPSALSVSVTPALDAVVRKAMAKRPEDRFAAASDFALALREAAEAKTAAVESFGLGLRISAMPRRRWWPRAAPARRRRQRPARARTGTQEKRPEPGSAGGAAVLVLAVLGGGGYALFGGHKQAAPSPASPPAPAVAQAPRRWRRNRPLLPPSHLLSCRRATARRWALCPAPCSAPICQRKP
ncbi:hypothetical protein GT370_14300 [Acidocella sp. MX-AZ03]|uniref:hypothetical protein n=1 Tax=Acidocella sp. MX-AZ03 TaxID=2697363 RepID=UPI0022DD1C38|nr:hypothetical protein [Acidocella sp. MX-AZ03]WBO58366.1 hypothetical protein GT370_14300 [Acidocella sp. MX-AZ03]